MLRYNAGKVPLSLIPTSFTKVIVDHHNPVPTRLIWQVGKVLDFGAQKYTAHNWRSGGSWSSCLDSALRHLFRMLEGAATDDESGLPETGHLGCNLAFLLEFQTHGLGTDDRFQVEGSPSINSDSDNPLIGILGQLLAWQDGGEIDHLKGAITQLADYVEPIPISTPEPTVYPFQFPIFFTGSVA